MLFGVYGVYMGFTDGIARAFAVDLVPRERRATALGLHATMTGLAAFAASAIADLLWQWLGPPAPFLYGAALAATAATLLALFVPQPQTAPR